MVIGICQVELYLPGVSSLKEKRSRLKPVLSRLRKEFNLSTAEIDLNDTWQSALIGLVTVSNDAGRAHALLDQSIRWMETHYPENQLVDWSIEVI
jgi:hypothetical protein